MEAVFSWACRGGHLPQPCLLLPTKACPHLPPVVGYSEEEAIQKLSGELDVYVSKFRPMK